MKKIYFLLVFSIVTLISNAQIINFSDPNLKTYLVSQLILDTNGDGYGDASIDTNNDGEIQQSEALVVTSLYIGYTLTPINNLTGIESFTNLVELNVDYSAVSSLNLTGLVQLKKLRVNNNNSLTALNVNACIALEELNCNNNHIASLSIANLPNLKIIHCQGNTMTSLSLSNLPALLTLDCVSNLLTTITFSALPVFEDLYCDANHMQSLNLTSIPSLKNLGCGSNQLTSLNLSASANLESLNCSNNTLNTLNVSNLVHLKVLVADGIGISTLNLSGLNDLTIISVVGNYLTTLNLDGLSNLTQVNCSSNNINSLSINGLSQLTYLNCGYNSISALDLTQCPNLEGFYCHNNQITSLNPTALSHCINFFCDNNLLTNIDVSGLTNVTDISIKNNLLTSLDLSNLHNLFYVLCDNNLLTYINAKNGHVESLTVSGNPNLLNICADDDQLGYLISDLQSAGMTNVTVSSYCTFTPGGIYNTIAGTPTFDYNSNGCDASDYHFPFLKIAINDGLVSGATFTTGNGYYSFYTQTGSYTVTPVLENTYFTISPVSTTISFADLNGTTQTQNFCITPIGIHYDVEITLIPIQGARPGFDARYKLVYKNKGNQILAGSIDLTFNDAILDFVSANPNTDSQVLNHLIWNYTALYPFESREIELTLNLNSPQETPEINIDDNLHYIATISTNGQDETPNDTVFELNQIVTGSLDPNDKTCLEGNTITPEMVGNYLHYLIRFQNSGTAAAENVVIKDIIDTTKFDMASLQLNSSSHPQVTKITGNKVEFQFQNINLPAEIDNEPGSHGYVAFKIKTKNNLVIGNSVSNKADIFFDYNFPIETNTATSTVALLGVNTFENTSVKVTPNPTKNIVHITSKDNITSVQLFDVQGRVLETITANDEAVDFDLSQKSSGVYFVKVYTVKGVKVEKVVKD